MARPREFDMEDALDAAISTFWTRGYEATSMSDLVRVTGLHKGSLYKAFDGKHDLFMKSLGRYLDGAHATMTATLNSSPSALEGLRAWLAGVAAMCSGQPVPRGCLAMNTAVELGPHDEQVANLLRRHHERASALLTATVERGQQDGAIRDDLPAAQLSKALFTLGAGLLGTSKVLAASLDVEEMVDASLHLLAPVQQPTS